MLKVCKRCSVSCRHAKRDHQPALVHLPPASAGTCAQWQRLRAFSGTGLSKCCAQSSHFAGRAHCLDRT